MLSSLSQNKYDIFKYYFLVLKTKRFKNSKNAFLSIMFNSLNFDYYQNQACAQFGYLV